MKIPLLLLAFLSIALCSEHETIDQQPTEQIQSISSFLLELINRYDQSGIGAIPIGKYPLFLSDVLIKGHLSVTPNAQVSQELQLLLLNATTDFTKKYNTTEVGVQDFYFDLVKQFTVYLIEHEDEYTPIIETFFGDSPYSDYPRQGDQNEEDNSQEENDQTKVQL